MNHATKNGHREIAWY